MRERHGVEASPPRKRNKNWSNLVGSRKGEETKDYGQDPDK